LAGHLLGLPEEPVADERIRYKVECGRIDVGDANAIKMVTCGVGAPRHAGAQEDEADDLAPLAAAVRPYVSDLSNL
jgi:hypothetical protein